MSLATMLYKLLIGPLEIFFEVIYNLTYRILGNPGLSIIGLSLAINFLVLPLYKQADVIQKAEADTEARLEPWVKHIKKTFKGDEQMMMLQTFYRQNNYKPTYALRGSLSLLLQIPFFIAAYNFLSNLDILSYCPFGPIHDLGAPDALIAIGSLHLNALPILMTLINVVSTIIYTKGMPRKSKLTLYAFAAIFLVLLYSSPAGLVFYWTLNNVFSLIKNVFYKFKNPKLVLYGLFAALGLLGEAYLWLFHPIEGAKTFYFLVVCCLLLLLPFLWTVLVRNKVSDKASANAPADSKLFYLGGIFLSLFVGLLIPSTFIAASTGEFIDVTNYINPIWYVVSALLLAAGTFLVWFAVFYSLATEEGKRLFGYGMWAASIIAAVDYMFFGRDYGNIASTLVYDKDLLVSHKEMLVNLLVVLLVLLVTYLIWKKLPSLLRVLYPAAILAVLLMSVLNIRTILSISSDTANTIAHTAREDDIQITLSKDGQNVVVIMMDMGISSYVPYLMEENPTLKEQFAGFTYYPNTVSYGAHTNVGTPALYGGYDYTPEEMNRRSDELLGAKQTEADLMLPVLFSNNGFDVTVCDPTYADYSWVPNITIFDSYPNIHAYITDGVVGNAEHQAFSASVDLYRNFFCFGIFKSAPVCMQSLLYNNGKYNQASASSFSQERYSLSTAAGASAGFLNAYYVLKNLSGITNITETSENAFFIMSNNTTHELTLLQEPAYEPSLVVNNTEYDAAHSLRYDENGNAISLSNSTQLMCYQCNMAAMIQLGNWFDYLKENGVWDNTRIILVSDHGAGIEQYDELLFDDADGELGDICFMNALLMVKDFNSKEFTTDTTFMTNADTATLATENVIENAENPFTHKAINSEKKTKEPDGIKVFYSENWDILTNNGTTFAPGVWYTVKDNIFDKKNWVKH